MLPLRRNLLRWMALRPRKAKRIAGFSFIFLLATLVFYIFNDGILIQLSAKASVDKDYHAIFPPSTVHPSLRSVAPRAPTRTVLTSITQCPNQTISFPLSRTKYFQAVDGLQTFVYSAYFDNGQVRLIAAKHMFDPMTLFCHIWFDSDTSEEPLSVIQATVEYIPENHGQTYSAAYIFCPISEARKDQLPVAVSVASSKCKHSAGNTLPVQRLGTLSSTFTVCVTPLNNKYSRVHEIVEMIEFNRLLGADRIAFYNLSISPVIDKVLRYYVKEGVVDVFPWNLPSQKIHYYGQLAALNDCLYQYRNISQYLVYEDLDEFIIPQGKLTSWRDLIEERKKRRPGTAIFQVKNVFFRREWPKTWPGFPFNEKVKNYKSVVLQTVIKEYRVLNYNLRSKYILDPLKTSTVGIHFIWESKAQLDQVPEGDALLCHYRNWENPDDKQKVLEDVSVIMRFGTKIIERLDRAWTALEFVLGVKPDAI